VRTLPTTMIQALASKRLWSHVQVLLAGTILAPGKRTVTSALRAVGLEEERQFCRYHRVLNRAAWSGAEAPITPIASITSPRRLRIGLLEKETYESVNEPPSVFLSALIHPCAWDEGVLRSLLRSR
jgi:hypothetical protein